MINFLILCADGYLDSNLVDEINNVMTFLLVGEISLKLIGYGIREFCKYRNNRLDSVILLLSLL